MVSLPRGQAEASGKETGPLASCPPPWKTGGGPNGGLHGPVDSIHTLRPSDGSVCILFHVGKVVQRQADDNRKWGRANALSCSGGSNSMIGGYWDWERTDGEWFLVGLS